MSNFYQHYTVLNVEEGLRTGALQARGKLRDDETYFRYISNDPVFAGGEITRLASPWFVGFPNRESLEFIRRYNNGVSLDEELTVVELLEGATGEAQVHHLQEFHEMYAKADALHEFNELSLRVGLECGDFAQPEAA